VSVAVLKTTLWGLVDNFVFHGLDATSICMLVDALTRLSVGLGVQ